MYSVCLGLIWRELGKWGISPRGLHFSAVLGRMLLFEAGIISIKEFSHQWKKNL